MLMISCYFSTKKAVNILILGRFGDGCGNNTTANRIRFCTISKHTVTTVQNVCQLDIRYSNSIATNTYDMLVIVIVNGKCC